MKEGRWRARSTTVRMPGTCGELVQGVIDGVPFHVTCPVELFAEVTVSQRDEPPPGGRRHWFKAQEAMHRTLGFLGKPAVRLGLAIRSQIPRGKGMASSTADVAGTIVATGLLLGQALDPATVARLALSVEPTDGSMFPGIVCFDHRKGRILETLGDPIPLAILALDFGGCIDTLAFNRVDRGPVLGPMETHFREALGMVRAGLALRDPSLVGKAASLSAECNQRILPKPFLPAVHREGHHAGAFGICVAHSGTVIGLLFDAERDDLVHVRDRMLRRLPDIRRTWLTRLVSGGARPISHRAPLGHLGTHWAEVRSPQQ